MYNPSPYDSGYDSSFSTASGPGQPHPLEATLTSTIRSTDISAISASQPSSWIGTDGPPPTTQDSDTATQPHTTPFNHHSQLYTSPHASNRCHLNPSRHKQYAYILPCLHTYARPPRTGTSPPDPYPSDGDDQLSTSSSPPPLMEASSDDDVYNRDPGISDDAKNANNRSFARTHTRLHLPHSDPPHPRALATTVFDIRVANHDSDSTPIYPDSSNSSDGDTPHYWPEVTHPSPPTPNSPPLATITERQLMDWTESQLPWNIFRQQISTYRDTPTSSPDHQDYIATSSPTVHTCTTMQHPMPTCSTLMVASPPSCAATHPGQPISSPFLHSSDDSTSTCHLHTATISTTPNLHPLPPPA